MPTRAEFTFGDIYPGEAFTVQVAPVSMSDLYAFREAWFKEVTTYDELWEQVERFAEIARPEWTLEGVDRVQGLDITVVKGLVNAWLAAVGSVPVPLPSPSSGTAPSPEGSTPTPASRSSRRRSSPAPSSTTPS